MQITVTLSDSQWDEFRELAQEAVETRYDGSYEDFATYIMSVNIDSYIESQKRRQAKKMKKALASYEESLKQEQNVPVVKVPEAKVEPAPKVPVKQSEDKPKEKGMSNIELSKRIAQLEEVPFKNRTMAEAQELNDLHILRKQRAKAKKK
jgi:hypothetical protein